MKTDRLLGLLSILADTDKITIRELSERLEVSKRTIYRDLEALNLAGIPIISYPGARGGVSIMDGYRVDTRVLTGDDKTRIYTALNGLKSIEQDPAITNLIAKLVPEQGAAVFSQSGYLIDLSSWFSDSVVHEKITALGRAVRDHRCIRMEYISRNARLSRIVEPHKLVFKQSDWYLYGYCRERMDFRLFKIRRIASLEVLDESFLPRVLDSIEFSGNYGEELYSSAKKDGLTEVVLEYDISDEFYLSGKLDASLFETAADGDSSTGHIRFHVSSLSRAADFVFAFLDRVRVVSPPELLDEIRQRLNKINIYYKGDI